MTAAGRYGVVRFVARGVTRLEVRFVARRVVRFVVRFVGRRWKEGARCSTLSLR